ncbi:hypothetical protein RRG08_045165 [Elysia crispata]|uniref:Uncharacterized protein n=1 Tax=Elysia crispata TaxID=231223 RepID=A0AAE1AE55_9GAST|nr:hypothetical protein RRG08_045165 [Elysia crispata]
MWVNLSAQAAHPSSDRQRCGYGLHRETPRPPSVMICWVFGRACLDTIRGDGGNPSQDTADLGAVHVCRKDGESRDQQQQRWFRKHEHAHISLGSHPATGDSGLPLPVLVRTPEVNLWSAQSSTAHFR